MLEGGADSDTLTGGAGGDAFLVGTGNARAKDRITDFGIDDFFVTRVALSDSNRDGRIDAGSNKICKAGGGSMAITGANGRAIRFLEFDGQFTEEGVSYYL
jgi:Ca2+-binding RTX toxin-like protein